MRIKSLLMVGVAVVVAVVAAVSVERMEGQSLPAGVPQGADRVAPFFPGADAAVLKTAVASMGISGTPVYVTPGTNIAVDVSTGQLQWLQLTNNVSITVTNAGVDIRRATLMFYGGSTNYFVTGLTNWNYMGCSNSFVVLSNKWLEMMVFTMGTQGSNVFIKTVSQ